MIRCYLCIFFEMSVKIFGCAGFLLLHWLFSRCGKWGLLSSCGVQAHSLLTVVVSLVAEHRL